MTDVKQATTAPAANPANAPSLAMTDPVRIPMSAPTQRLQVVSLPGFHTHWMRGTPERIQQALSAGYTYVTDEEVRLNYKGLSDLAAVGGNTDLGSHVSVSAGRSDDRGQPIRLILMKIPDRFRKDDLKSHDDSQEMIARSLREGNVDQDKSFSADNSHRYVGNQNRNIFNRRA